jgi:hypothetical protein
MLEFGSGDLIQPGETAFHLDLTAPELKLTYTALRALHDDLGHEEHDVRQVVADVLAKLPDEHVIRAIDVTRELEALRRRDADA